MLLAIGIWIPLSWKQWAVSMGRQIAEIAIAAAKARIDAAGVSDEAYAVDIAGEIEKAIAKARGKRAEADDD